MIHRQKSRDAAKVDEPKVTVLDIPPGNGFMWSGRTYIRTADTHGKEVYCLNVANWEYLPLKSHVAVMPVSVRVFVETAFPADWRSYTDI